VSREYINSFYMYTLLGILFIIAILFYFQRRSTYDTPVDCVPGTFQSEGACIPCPVNTYCPDTNTPTPIYCPEGLSSGSGSAACSTDTVPLCEPGTYSDTGVPPCTKCPANTYCAKYGMTTPRNCPKSSVSAEGSSNCKTSSPSVQSLA
jgi:hypothetical protein